MIKRISIINNAIDIQLLILNHLNQTLDILTFNPIIDNIEGILMKLCLVAY